MTNLEFSSAIHPPPDEFFRNLERKRTQALVEQDMALAEELHAPQYHLITPGGKSFNRQNYLSDIASGSLRYVQWELGSIEVRSSASMGVVRYQALLKFPSGNAIACWHTDSYELHDGQWKAVWSQATAIPNTAAGV
ncbi:MAG: nuclear transport factor 2 family protein [Pseudomonadota bacterium]